MPIDDEGSKDSAKIYIFPPSSQSRAGLDAKKIADLDSQIPDLSNLMAAADTMQLLSDRDNIEDGARNRRRDALRMASMFIFMPVAFAGALGSALVAGDYYSYTKTSEETILREMGRYNCKAPLKGQTFFYRTPNSVIFSGKRGSITIEKAEEIPETEKSKNILVRLTGTTKDGVTYTYNTRWSSMQYCPKFGG